MAGSTCAVAIPLTRTGSKAGRLRLADSFGQRAAPASVVVQTVVGSIEIEPLGTGRSMTARRTCFWIETEPR